MRLYDFPKKRQEVEKVSNPNVVYHNAMTLLDKFDDVEMHISSRKNKKYMIKGEFTNDKKRNKNI